MAAELMGRTDTGSRLIAATPDRLYRAHVDPVDLAAWRAPEGMRGEIIEFDARPGGVYRMALIYEDGVTAGKSGGGADVFEGRFLALEPGRRIVETVEFESEDPAFAGTMTITTTFAAADGGTLVSVACADVPPGISKSDHQAGIASSLANLARRVEAS
ncbi:MAG: SRPBCC domain-containing protein [Caulobacter sp.]